MATVTRFDDIKPDGVRIHIKWDQLAIGASMFIPCINTTKAKAQLNKIAEEKGMTLDLTPRIESGQWGLRVWRVA